MHMIFCLLSTFFSGFKQLAWPASVQHKFCVRSQLRAGNFILYTKVIIGPVANTAWSLLSAICNHDCCIAKQEPPQMCIIRLSY